jgi:hypothetical protein
MRRAFIFCSGPDSSLLRENISSFLDTLGELKDAVGVCTVDEEGASGDGNIYRKHYEELASRSSSPDFYRKLKDAFGDAYVEREILAIFAGSLNSPDVVRYLSQANGFFSGEEFYQKAGFVFYPVLYYYDEPADYPQIFANLREVERILAANSSVGKVFLTSDAIENGHKFKRTELVDTISFFLSQLPLQANSGLDIPLKDLGGGEAVPTSLKERLSCRFVSFGLSACYAPYRETREAHAAGLSTVALQGVFNPGSEDVAKAYSELASKMEGYGDFEKLKSRIMAENVRLKQAYLVDLLGERRPSLPTFNFAEEIEGIEERVVEWQTVLFDGSLRRIRTELETAVLGDGEEEGSHVRSRFEEEFVDTLRSASLEVVAKKGAILLSSALKRYAEDVSGWQNRPLAQVERPDSLEPLREEFAKSVKTRVVPSPHFFKATLVAILAGYIWFLGSTLYFHNLVAILGVIGISVLVEGFAFFRYYRSRREIESRYDEWTEGIASIAERTVDRIPFSVSSELAAKLLPYVEGDSRKLDCCLDNAKNLIGSQMITSAQPENAFIKKAHMYIEKESESLLELGTTTRDVLASLGSIRMASYDGGVTVDAEAIAKEFREWANRRSAKDVTMLLTPSRLLRSCLDVYRTETLAELVSKMIRDAMLLVSLTKYDVLIRRDVPEAFAQDYGCLVCLPSGLEEGLDGGLSPVGSSTWGDRSVPTAVSRTCDQQSLYVVLLLAYFPSVQLDQIQAMAKAYWELPKNMRAELHCLYKDKDSDSLPRLYQATEARMK